MEILMHRVAAIGADEPNAPAVLGRGPGAESGATLVGPHWNDLARSKFVSTLAPAVPSPMRRGAHVESPWRLWSDACIAPGTHRRRR